MNNYGKIKIRKGSKLYKSDSGYYDYWYPSSNEYFISQNDCYLEHLFLWKHQDNFLAFSAKAKDLCEKEENGKILKPL